MGWEALEQWGDDVARIEPLAGGVANQVWSVRVNEQLAVGRLGARSDADLAWETDLLRHLDREGLMVPVPIATTAGRLFADGLVVMTYVEGGPPEAEADWRRVADMLRQLHRLTQGWPQRPGWRSSTDLLDTEIGTKIDLGAMPAAVTWNLVTWRLGLPSSSGHALVGGLVGAAVVEGGVHAINWGGIEHWRPVGVFGILIALALSPVLGGLAALLLPRGGLTRWRRRCGRRSCALRR
jgi:Phosphate transporter family/Phosphotransferase enzyme family